MVNWILKMLGKVGHLWYLGGKRKMFVMKGKSIGYWRKIDRR